ncbi:MAG: hypothetical protein J5606_04205 [Bacteroidales bacterium]|nr:hypothetical protein [Bacteroidales bacterium]
MVTQIGNKKSILYLFFISIVLFSCNKKREIKEISNIINIPIEDKIVFDSKEEFWGDFLSDGYKILVFNIIDTMLIQDASLKMHPYDMHFIEVNYYKSEVYKYLYNSDGFYQKQINNDVIKIIFINKVTNQLIYYLIIW